VSRAVAFEARLGARDLRLVFSRILVFGSGIALLLWPGLVAIAQAAGDAPAGARFVGQQVGLSVAVQLQAMFDLAQEAIGRLQVAAFQGGQEPFALQFAQGCQGVATADGGMLSAVQ